MQITIDLFMSKLTHKAKVTAVVGSAKVEELAEKAHKEWNHNEHIFLLRGGCTANN